MAAGTGPAAAGGSERRGATALLSVGGILAAIGASSCCVIPLALFTLGVSGAWIADLTALEPYQPVFVALALACVGGGFVLARRKPQAACAEGSSCARPASGRIVRFGLWTAVVLVTVAVVLPRLAPLIISS